MKIIFENAEEKEKFIQRMDGEAICVADLLLEKPESCANVSCLMCWRIAVNRSEFNVEN